MVSYRAQLATLPHYVDDFFVGRPGTSECARLMRECCKLLGVPLASEKEVGPATRLVFLGIVLDSVAQTVSLLVRLERPRLFPGC